MKVGNSLANENQLKFNSNESENLLKKLATARRINSAADDAAGAALDPAAVDDPHAVSESAVIDASTRANNFFFMLILLFIFSLGCRILIYPAAIGYCLSLVRILANTHISVNSLSC